MAMNDDAARIFEREAKKPQPGAAGEFLLFLRENKKYWLIPLLGTLLLVGLLAALGGTAAAPFIYTLF